ncbi:MAG TPA: hypothetical protein VGC97_08820 [Pyrinomonadaceae bacterium]|jgi:hypothetical protein
MASNIENQILHNDSPNDEVIAVEPNFLEENLKRLSVISSYLRLFGLTIVSFSFLCIGLTIILGVGKSIFDNNDYYSSSPDILSRMGKTQAGMVFTFLIIFEILNFLFVVIYDSRLKQGNAIFEEISDELQWNINKAPTQSNSSSAVADNRPELETRIILRTYARTTDLPLFPGKYGPALYIFLNIISFFLSAFFYNLLINPNVKN